MSRGLKASGKARLLPLRFLMVGDDVRSALALTVFIPCLLYVSVYLATTKRSRCIGFILSGIPSNLTETELVAKPSKDTGDCDQAQSELERLLAMLAWRVRACEVTARHHKNHCPPRESRR